MVNSRTNRDMEQLLRYAAKLTGPDFAEIDRITFDYLLGEITRQIHFDPAENFSVSPTLKKDRRYKGMTAATTVLNALPEDELFGEEELTVRMQIDDLATLLYDEYSQKGSVIVSAITNKKERDSAVYFQNYIRTRQTMVSIQEHILSQEARTEMKKKEKEHNRQLYETFCNSLTKTESGIQLVNRRDETGYKTIITHFSSAKILYALCKEFLDEGVFSFEQRFEATERDLQILGERRAIVYIERQLNVYRGFLKNATLIKNDQNLDSALETQDKHCDMLLSVFEGYIDKHEYAVFCKEYAKINREQQFHKEMTFDSEVTIPKIESRLGLDNVERRLIPTPDYVGGRRTTDKPVLYINSK